MRFTVVCFSYEFLLCIRAFGFQGSVYRPVRFETRSRYLTLGCSSCYRAFIDTLADVRTVCVAAFADVGQKLAEGWEELLEREEIKSREVYKRKPRGVGKEAYVITRADIEYLNVSCGMLAALDLM